MKTILLTALALTFSVSAFAADPASDPMSDPKMAAMMKKMQDYATPGEQHKKLAEMAGNWNYTSKMWMGADDRNPGTSNGTSVIKMIMGGRWMQQDVKGTVMGQPFEGMGLLGYNNVTKKYETFWFDTMSTGGMHGLAKMENDTLKDSGKFTCPADGKERTYRTEWKMIDANNSVFSMYGKGMSGKGKEFKEMEMTYTRAK